MNKKYLLPLGVSLLLVAVVSYAVQPSAAGLPSAADLDRMTKEMINTSFAARGIATMDRLNPDEVNQLCSQADVAGKPLDDATARRIQAAQMQTIQWPADGRFLGDWREGELIAQSGRGLTWTDVAAAAANGGNCFNCHQISPGELSFGTLGPSLLHYGRLRGVTDPNSPEARPIVEYTWGKLSNPRAYNACSQMPRAGTKGILTQEQLRHVMALLLDPESPVNRP